MSQPQISLLVLALGISAQSLSAPLANPAAAFGARESVEDISLSPNGQQLAWLQPGPGQVTELYVAAASGGEKPRRLTLSDGRPFRLQRCNWAADHRLICLISGLGGSQKKPVPFTRLVALDDDGGNVRELGQQDSIRRLFPRQFDGDVLDWLAQDGSVLMERIYVPDYSTGTHLGSALDGLGVDRIDTRSLKVSQVERPSPSVQSYFSDGSGSIRMMAVVSLESSLAGLISSTVRYRYRPSDSREWREFGTFDVLTRDGVLPLQVDGSSNSVYALKRLDGRDALYRIKLDGTLATELVYAHPAVDVDDLVTIGARRRPIGASYITEDPAIEYFNAADAKLVKSLSKALPAFPDITLVDASRDEKQLLVRASSDQDPGRYFVFDRTVGTLNEVLVARPELEGVLLSVVKAVTYATADGVKVPAYLTLPPGSAGKNLPGIVLPHGGPGARDEGGFDWLAQFFAQRGYAVLQPNFRGSSGYGDDWLVDNGFKSWKIAIGDVNDAGRWLVKEGIVVPEKLAILGWSYGGYAALQANVLDPNLFKATVAIAPVTDFAMLKEESRGFTNRGIVTDFIGTGAHIVEGSPAANAAAFKAPVLMFHGGRDDNVGIQQSRTMDAVLRKAGKRSELIEYANLEHDLADSAARTDLLKRSDEFLRANLGPVN